MIGETVAIGASITVLTGTVFVAAMFLTGRWKIVQPNRKAKGEQPVVVVRVQAEPDGTAPLRPARRPA